MRRSLALALVAAFASTAAVTARADEPLFGFLYTTDLLPKGGTEVEQWATWRHKKAGGIFDLVEGQTELSYGVSENLQVSGYLIYDWTQAYHNGPDGTTTAPEQYSAYFPSADEHFSKWLFQGIAGEVLWRVASPYTDPVGIALYVEPIIGPHFRELEVKGIFQKNYLDDRLVIVGNMTWAPEFRPVPGDPSADPSDIASHANLNIETDLNFGIGASYRFAPNWSAGAEIQNEREMNGMNFFDHKQWMGNGYYAGPTVHYADKSFFATLTWWQQLPFAKNYMDSSMIVHHYDEDVDFERTRVRLKVGYYF